METRERITRDDLRGMAEGETRSYALPSPQACEAGKATAWQMGAHLGCKFRTEINYEARVLTITMQRSNDD